jgi:hypothetical protein
MNYIRLVFLVLILFSLGACNGTPPAAKSTPTPEPSATAAASPTAPLSPFEQDLRYVRNGGYTFVWVFSRKDGKLLDKEDGEFLRTNAPQVVDWVGTDGGRKIIAGTNFNLEEGNLALIKKRFNAEDYSAR